MHIKKNRVMIDTLFFFVCMKVTVLDFIGKPNVNEELKVKNYNPKDFIMFLNSGHPANRFITSFLEHPFANSFFQ